MEVEKLFDYIKDEINKYIELTETLGKDHPMARKICAQICGMEKAFAVVAGVSYTDYLIAKVS